MVTPRSFNRNFLWAQMQRQEEIDKWREYQSRGMSPKEIIQIEQERAKQILDNKIKYRLRACRFYNWAFGLSLALPLLGFISGHQNLHSKFAFIMWFGLPIAFLFMRICWGLMRFTLEKKEAWLWAEEAMESEASSPPHSPTPSSKAP